MFMEFNARPQNGFLRSLDAADFEVIRPHLQTAELTQSQVLLKFGEPVEQIYFPHTCLLSRMLELDTGESMEIAMIGRDSVLGALAATGTPSAQTGAIVIWPGLASVIDTRLLRAAAERSPALSATLAQHGQSLLIQAQQAMGCKALHPVESRLARWLSQVRDMTGSDRFTMTQETMAQMIGARQNSVSIVVQAFERENLISHGHGEVEIINPRRLVNTACKCYAAIKSQHESLRWSVEHPIERREVRIGC